jgi:hypothetical protein
MITSFFEISDPREQRNWFSKRGVVSGGEDSASKTVRLDGQTPRDKMYERCRTLSTIVHRITGHNSLIEIGG